MTTHGLSDFRPYYAYTTFPTRKRIRKKRTNHHDLIIDVYTQSQYIYICIYYIYVGRGIEIKK